MRKFGEFMATPRVEVLTGPVAGLALSAQTPIAPSEAGTLRTINRMRFSLKAEDGKDQSFTFTNSSVFCREGDRVSVVRARGRTMPDWVVVVLRNHSTGQSEENPLHLRQVCAQKWLSARLRALIGALIFAGGFWIYLALTPPPGANLMAVAGLAAISLPSLWALLAVLDAYRLPRGEKREIERLRFEIKGRLMPLDAPLTPIKPDQAIA